MLIYITIIILYLTHILYYYILYYYILYSYLIFPYNPYLLFPSSDLFLLLFYLPPSSIFYSSSPLIYLILYLPFLSQYSLLFFFHLQFYSSSDLYSSIQSYIFIFSSSSNTSTNIHSILVGTYIYLFIFSSDLPNPQISDPARSIGVDG